MATRIYGISRSEQYNQISEGVGSAVASDSMEFTFDLAANLTKQDVLNGLELIRQHIIKGNFPPA